MWHMICDIWKVAHDTWHRSRDSVSLYTGFLHSEMFRVIRGQNQRPNQNIKKSFCGATKSTDIQKHGLIVFASYHFLRSGLWSQLIYTVVQCAPRLSRTMISNCKLSYVSQLLGWLQCLVHFQGKPILLAQKTQLYQNSEEQSNLSFFKGL